MSTKINTVSCSVGDLSTCSATDFTAFTAFYWSERQFRFPMSADEVARQFPASFDIFQAYVTTADPETQTFSNLNGGNEVTCPFLMCGICVQITTSTQAYALNAGVYDAPPPALLEYDGVTRYTDPATAPQPGVLEIGHCAWQFAIAFLQSYSLRFVLQCRYELFNKPLSEIGCVDKPDEMSGFGTSLIAAAAGFVAANEQQARRGLGSRIVPANSLATTAAGPNNALALAPTTLLQTGGPTGGGSLNGFFHWSSTFAVLQ